MSSREDTDRYEWHCEYCNARHSSETEEDADRDLAAHIKSAHPFLHMLQTGEPK